LGVQTFCSSCPRQGRRRKLQWFRSLLDSQPVAARASAAVGGKYPSQLEPAPDAKFVKRAAQVILDDLSRRAHALADLSSGDARATGLKTCVSWVSLSRERMLGVYRDRVCRPLQLTRVTLRSESWRNRSAGCPVLVWPGGSLNSLRLRLPNDAGTGGFLDLPVARDRPETL
jgi:hypothetical protein